METDDPVALTKILDAEEIEQIPTKLQEKLTTALNGLIADYCKEKSASYRIGDYEQKTEDLQSQIQDYEHKLKNYEQNVSELRAQLDEISAERSQLREVAKNHDKDMVKLRKEKNDAIEERDSLLLLIERHTSEEDRMKCDIQSYQQQLSNAINAKCEAIARIDEIESKEVAMQMKERRFEQELAGLRSENIVLREDLSRHLVEIQNLRRDNTLHSLHIDTRLTEKTNELKIAKSQIAQYVKTIEELNESIHVDTENRQKQREESDNIIEQYKIELQMKTKLAGLYKASAEDAKKEREELHAGVEELRRYIQEASAMYGTLETEYKTYKLKSEQTLDEKDKAIDALKEELRHANDLLKEIQEESVESAISKLAPTAAITSRLMRSDMSLTELYSLYVKTTEELSQQKLENAKLKLHMKNIVDELQQQAPTYEAQRVDYHKLNTLHTKVTQENEELNKLKQELMSKMNEANTKIQYLESENKKLDRSRQDLFRQMACIIQEVEHLRVGIEPKRPTSSSNETFTNCNDVISKKLVTFTSITELVSNNAKLLMTVQDFGATLEEYEKNRDEEVKTRLKDKLESYDKKIEDFQKLLDQKNVALTTALDKCERYKKMYFEQQKKMGKKVSQTQFDNSILDSSVNEEDPAPSTAKNTEEKQNENEQDIGLNDMKNKIYILEQQLANAQENYKAMKEEYEYYKGEKKNNDKLFQEQFDAMRTELRDLTSANFKVSNNNEYLSEQNKVLIKNNANYKQQVIALEDRNKNYESTIVKHEQTVLLLKDDTMNAHRKVAAAESEANALRHENRMLKDMVSRLQAEKDVYNREQQSQTLLLNNLEFIKSNLERSEAEGRIRLEQRLEDTSRELAAQRRHFQEEEDSYREKINDLNRQTETALKRMEDEKQQTDKLREELTAMREDIAAKTSKIDELSKKLQESLSPSTADNPITVANKKAREYEMKYEETKIEMDSLANELAKAREHGEQFYKMSQNSEAEIKRLHDVHVAYVSDAEAKLEELRQSEARLKTRISELEAEIMLTNVTKQSKNLNQPDELKTAQEELKNTLLKLTEANKSIRSLQAENATLTESLNNTDEKYTNEMIQHSADIQELSKLKAEFTKVRDEIKMNTCGKETSEAAYEELKKSHEELQRALLTEKEEYEKHVEDLNILNSNLHDQIDALSSKLVAITQSNTSDHSLNESGLNSSMSDLNRSQLNEENKGHEKLLQIIKYLRKEKDICGCKLDIARSELSRVQSENGILQKRVVELESFRNQELSRTDSNALSAVKHEEILRKIETLNAVTDSNRILREERNELVTRVNELKLHNSTIEEELFPLKANNSELTSKVEELSVENSSLRTEAMKWRQRANALVDSRSNKNPEEIKRLQLERENLNKMLAQEKEGHKKALDEITTLKTKLESEITTLNKQLQGLSEERRKLYDDNLNSKQTISRFTQELMDIKNTMLQKEDDLQKANEEVQLKETQLQDSRNKELQLRKIAKRYKDSFTSLSNRVKTELKLDTTEFNNLITDESSTIKSGELENLRTQIDELTTTMNAKDKQMEKERDEHKKTAEVSAQSAEVLRDCRTKIVSLTEFKVYAQQEIAKFKKQVIDDSTSYNEKIASLEKELQDQITSSKETTMRLSRENESLHMRINQLNRQLGLQQSAKPTTSSVAITEKGSISDSSPRTANVKPMSGSATVQQSATVTPWRGSETTPLASIRPISVQSSRTAAILPTSQQTSAGSSSTSSTTTTSSTSASGSNASTGNTALVPPQQQVHTTGTSSIEAIASSSPTSSHTDYMPSTSSASVAVAAIPPMGAASAAESSQEAESVQQPQQNDPQIYGSGGGQQQVVALVSPRVEGSSSSTTTSTQSTTVPCVQLSQDLNNQQQQPSTSGTSSTSSTVVSSHSRHTPSSSSVTTTQAGCSSLGHKRPREIEGDSTNADESGNDKIGKQTKRSRSVLHGGDSTSTLNMGDSGIDVDQMPTSSQRDQEDDVVVIVSEDEEDQAMVDADDDEPMDGCDVEQEEGYDYEQDQDIDDNECPENVIEEGEIDMRDQDTNEVDIDEGSEQQSQQCTSGTENQSSIDLSESSAAAATSDTDNNQQSQAISSGSGETTSNTPNIPQSAAGQWKQASSSTSSSSVTALRRSDNSTEIVSSPQVSKSAEDDDNELKVMQGENAPNGSETATESYTQNNIQGDDEATSGEPKESDKGEEDAVGADDNVEGDDDFSEEAAGLAETTEEGDGDAVQQGGNATQSEIQDNQLSQIEGTSEDNEGTDGVSSEGEKQAVEGVEEEGREAEATTSPTMNTRSKSMRGSGPGMRRGGRLSQRGPGNNRPTPIIWQEASGNSRNMHNLRHQQHDQQMMSPQNRMYNPQRGPRGRRTMRRPNGNPYNNPNMRFP